LSSTCLRHLNEPVKRFAVALGLLLTLFGGCGDDGRRATATSGREELPTAVANKRQTIVAAAHAMDYERLGTLLDPAKFSYSFGESGDPIGYWRRLEREGHVPIIGDYLPVLLSGPWAKRGNIYVWPSVYGKPPSRWTSAERRWLRNHFYSEMEIRAFARLGDYLGWRVGIRADGTWLFFVSGD
jgi:hypothetical protein